MEVLLLIPTRLELEMLPGAPSYEAALDGSGRFHGARVGLTGFGPIDAAASAMAAMVELPDLVVLAGLAGSYDIERDPPGKVVEVASSQLLGLGAGFEPDSLLPEDMNLPAAVLGSLAPQSREVATATLPGGGRDRVDGLTVCAAALDDRQARARCERFPTARIEDMESFAVARAAHLVHVPFACLRAVGNRVGDRDKRNWRVEEAMSTLGAELSHVLELL